MRDSASDPSTLRAASYNIRKCVGLDWRRRPDRVIEVIAALRADIVALQEADKRLGARPAALCGAALARQTGLVPVAVADNDVSLGWHGNAILVRRGIEVERVTRLDLPGLEPRGAVIADLRRGGQPLRVVAAHLGLLRRHRQRQLGTIADRLAGLAPRPTMIMGDFNEWSDTAGLEPLQPAFTVHAPGRSYHAARRLAPLDRIATCPAFELRGAGMEEGPQAARASDHLPIWADLSLRG
ncbi:endonuclease/exonuclease/phosphatase family protein [Actibacterium sp. MT2.3-13A]|uniref:endonuclease/exonuclease/phosphatase family protein n=1 Tax=Actibacterium sp. MT2.3-13A TaxID=2828332 RepID=UPI001BA80BFD|nr:endonuclease/exonuclease/phosphatase family protein [Actibacterium sp. MT2.3-13A]